jgi:hypothetical protein
MLPFRCHKRRLDMSKTELQVARSIATETNKRLLEDSSIRLASSHTKRLELLSYDLASAEAFAPASSKRLEFLRTRGPIE